MDRLKKSKSSNSKGDCRKNNTIWTPKNIFDDQKPTLAG